MVLAKESRLVLMFLYGGDHSRFLKWKTACEWLTGGQVLFPMIGTTQRWCNYTLGLHTFHYLQA